MLMVVQALSNNKRYANQAYILRVGHARNENVHLSECKHALERGEQHVLDRQGLESVFLWNCNPSFLAWGNTCNCLNVLPAPISWRAKEIETNSCVLWIVKA